MKNKLTAKQAKFVSEYIKDLNATQAAIRSGYSAKTAYSQGQRLLKNVEVKLAIGKLSEKAFDRNEISVDRILQETAKIAFLDISKAFDSAGNLLDITKMPKDIVAAIGGLEVSSSEIGDSVTVSLSKIKIIEKIRALDLLGKYHALWVDKSQVEVKEPIRFIIDK